MKKRILAFLASLFLSACSGTSPETAYSVLDGPIASSSFCVTSVERSGGGSSLRDGQVSCMGRERVLREIGETKIYLGAVVAACARFGGNPVARIVGEIVTVQGLILEKINLEVSELECTDAILPELQRSVRNAICSPTWLGLDCRHPLSGKWRVEAPSPMSSAEDVRGTFEFGRFESASSSRGPFNFRGNVGSQPSNASGGYEVSSDEENFAVGALAITAAFAAGQRLEGYEIDLDANPHELSLRGADGRVEMTGVRIAAP